MILTQVTAPTRKVVETKDLCDWLRVTSEEERAVIEGLEAAAVGHLDGWGGVLGRAIRSQVWRQEFAGWGDLRLAMPDVSAIEVTAEDAAGDAVVPTRSELRQDACGPYVITEGPDVARVFVDFTSGLPGQRIPVAQTIVKTLVAHWFRNRESVGEGSMAEIPLSATALIDQLRWSRF
jgi:uncharacterized phiE125 gp8 family phage protein